MRRKVEGDGENQDSSAKIVGLFALIRKEHCTLYTTAQHTTPHHTTLHHTTPHYTTPHHTTPHHITPHRATPHHTVLHYTTPHYTTPRHTTPHHTPHHTTPHHTTLHHTTRSCSSACELVVQTPLLKAHLLASSPEDAFEGVLLGVQEGLHCASVTRVIPHLMGEGGEGVGGRGWERSWGGG